MRSPFAAIVEPSLVQAAAERAARLDLPRRRSDPWTARDTNEGDEGNDSDDGDTYDGETDKN